MHVSLASHRLLKSRVVVVIVVVVVVVVMVVACGGLLCAYALAEWRLEAGLTVSWSIFPFSGSGPYELRDRQTILGDHGWAKPLTPHRGLVVGI